MGCLRLIFSGSVTGPSRAPPREANLVPDEHESTSKQGLTRVYLAGFHDLGRAWPSLAELGRRTGDCSRLGPRRVARAQGIWAGAEESLARATEAG